ncbi:774c7837-8354-484d-a155-8d7aeba91e63 [Thermothielavioides terrestris]|uniref:774c7837-8354-484d-a155-8d7aeba91e63 n=1 Tax=Thermothielavioides terrestris TaxID=2587410 RepID=A0A3S4BFD0_9PEZI|nr:774c7837-8354-484d-a155-8d7aeba91e63 [Thermothielavioides terrestris]
MALAELPRQTWEDKPSFFTYAEIYFAAEYFGLEHLKAGMVRCVEELSRRVVALGDEPHCAHCPYFRAARRDSRAAAAAEWEAQQHLASFLDAVVSVEEHPWSARIQKAVYDAGDRMKTQLVRLPAFRDFVERYPGGKGFARAIGLGGCI